MAYKCCHPVKFTRVKDTGFYFKDDGTDVEEDRFAVSKSQFSVLRSTIQDKDGAILVLDSELRLEGRRINIVEEFDNEFNIRFYVDDNRRQKGRPVILYATKEGKNMLVCCNDNHEVHPVAKDPPEEISEDKDKAVFYMTDLTTSMFMFESSYFPSKFLAFEHDESNSVKKLVLLHKDKGKVIESAQLYLQSLTE